ncbi:hypothetical protein NM688_g560 [Phlebia brevispora]|uniref:Uncharacterized protein n=1 Tax=Phlebia brevispora TaxID=194682 RepID=A0ACC1TE61_9APHY|nr:hypothetical protein NM688_g560 [Phlebia brevispora]
MDQLTVESLSKLKITDILGLVRDRLIVPGAQRRPKERLVTWVLEQADENTRALLAEAVARHRENEAVRTRMRKRKRQQEVIQRRQSRRLDDDTRDVASDFDAQRYLDLPTWNEKLHCYEDFIQATSNNALRHATCAVCGLELNVAENGVEVMALRDVPNKERLRPVHPHPAHNLYGGIILEPEGIVSGAGAEVAINICNPCLTDLAMNKSGPPRLSLANDLWIGSVPWQLRALSLAEQQLIALLYPRIYVFKIFPKDRSTRELDMDGDEETKTSTLQRAMAGSVCTYELDARNVADMLEGKLMPRRLNVLSSVIAVTFVGRGRLPKAWLMRLFHVRREVVRAALLWLKANNPKYYGDIEISEEILSTLPEDDVPEEISSLVRQSTDMDLIDEGAAPYVQDYVQNTSAQSDDRRVHFDVEEDIGSDEPQIVPMQVTGAVDTDMTKLTRKDLDLWSMANTWKSGYEGLYAVRPGTRWVSDWGPSISTRNPPDGERPDGTQEANFFERAFPCLFPYGRGGIEANRPVNLDMQSHVRWLLQYCDRRFRKHETFVFVVFATLQRRQTLRSARLQMQRRDFERDIQLLSTITVERLKKAQEEEEHHLPISDPAVFALRGHFHATAGRVMGSDQSRHGWRSEIWSTCVFKGPATVWLTLSPNDIHDPIVQVLVGEEVDLDHFVATLGPDNNKRAENVAADPYAAAKYFHIVLQALLETLFQVKVGKFRVESGMGVLGHVDAYFVAVESQGRGTLHAHMLLWLKDTPSPEEIRSLLRTEAFPRNLYRLYHANETSDTIVHLTRMHLTSQNGCVSLSYEWVRCKRRAPWKLAAEAFVKETGEWGPKREYGFLNTWQPDISVCLKCNNDIALMTSGRDTMNISFYITSYTAKKQNRNYSLAAAMTEGFAYHLQHPVPEYIENVREQQRLMLFRLTQAMSLHQVLAEPMVMSLVMGWSDVKRSHRYTPLFWSAFTSSLVACFPDLIDVNRNNRRTTYVSSRLPDGHEGSTVAVTGEADAEETGGADAEETDRVDDALRNESGEHDAQEEEATDLVTLCTRGDGRIYARSQISDYVCRGTELDEYNVLQFFKDTYEEYGSRLSPLPETRPESQAVDLTLHEDEDEDEEDDNDSHRRRGRRRNIRSKYTSAHPESDVKQRVVRSPNHRNLLKFIGRWFPSNDDPAVHDFYCASALMLFKPWRNIRTDLKPESLSWSAAFEEYFGNASEQMKRMLGGLQYFHECKSAAETGEEENIPIDDFAQRAIRGDGEFEDDDDIDMADEGSANSNATEYDENALKALLSTVVPERELQHAELAIAHARSAKIFGHDLAHWDVFPTSHTSNATMGDLERLSRWKEQLAKDVDKQDAIFAEPRRGDGHQGEIEGRPPTIELCTDDDDYEGDANAGDSAATAGPGRLFCESLDPAQVFDLRADQFRAFDIVRWHLDQTLKGLDLPPLRMIIYGEGGTGKSKVIQTITAEFQRRGVRHLLVKAAYTGVAASLIDGKTCNVIAAIPVGGSTERMSQKTKDGLETFWKPRYYLIVDEYSMLGKTFLRLMSNRISIAKLGSGSTDLDDFFGGMSVILCGDLHQFPPVATRPSEYLFHPNDLVHDSDHSKLGRKIYESFETVVILKEQMRVVDPVWNDMLHHLRKGEMRQSDIDMLHSLVLKPGSPDVDFSKPPWDSATLVTPRHAVRKLWNHVALRKYCKEHGEQLLIVDAEDSVRYRGERRQPTAAERYAVALRLKTKGTRPNRDLPRTLEFAKGMEVMVTENLQTDLDITNGARGTIVDIVLDPREPPVGDANEVHLQYMPAYILVKMRKTRASPLEGLDEGIIPLQPVDMTMRIKIRSRDHNHSLLTRTVHRRQYALVAAYAYTDYRAQGQTLPVVIVDIAQPPTGRLTLFNLYVALSRSSGRQTIRLLRDFNDAIFLQAHNPDLLLEDERLQRLDRKTYEAWKMIGGEGRMRRDTNVLNTDVEMSNSLSSVLYLIRHNTRMEQSVLEVYAASFIHARSYAVNFISRPLPER